MATNDTWSEVRTLRKSGAFEQARRVGEAALDAGEEDRLLLQQMLFVYQSLVKSGKPERTPDEAVRGFEDVLRKYCKSNPVSPDKWHSIALGSTRHVGRKMRNYLGFLKTVAGDRAPEAQFLLEDLAETKWGDGVREKSPPLAAEIARELFEWCLADDQRSQQDIEEAIRFYDALRPKISSGDLTWLNKSRAKVMLKLGNESAAFEGAVGVLKKKPHDGWAWASVGETLLTSDPGMATACYANAIQLGKEERFLVGYHMRLARLLRDAGDYAWALSEVEMSVGTYESTEGWGSGRKAEDARKLRDELQSRTGITVLSSTEIKQRRSEVAKRAESLIGETFRDAEGNELVDEKLTCVDCGKQFIFAAREQAFFESKGFTKPRRCPACRKKKKIAQAAGA